MNIDRLSGILQASLTVVLLLSLGLLYNYHNWYMILLSIVVFKITQTFGSGLGHHIWISHKSVKLSRLMRYWSVFCLVLCGVNRPNFYSKYHILHHKYIDSNKDPHSPVNYNKWYLILGFWVLRAYEYNKYLTKDMIYRSTEVINSFRSLKFVDKYYYTIIFSLILVCSYLSLEYTFYLILLPMLFNNLDGNYFFIYLVHTNGKVRNIKWLNYWILGKGGDHMSHHRFSKKEE